MEEEERTKPVMPMFEDHPHYHEEAEQKYREDLLKQINENREKKKYEEELENRRKKEEEEEIQRQIAER